MISEGALTEVRGSVPVAGHSGAEHLLARLARHKRLMIVLTGAIALAARAVLLPILPVPKPAIQDEHSYLLASDTFASGRLTNPTPLFPAHFETPQVILHPTYASKYPPFSGLVMALGQKLTGEPWAGVWLSMGVLCATICWALQGWLPPAWALAGSLIALLKIGIVSYWSESYWGGSCAAIGGALLIGAAPRLIRRIEPGPALAFAAGLAILANTRPYEGLVLAIACAGYVCILTPWPGFGALARKAILPMTLVLVPVFAWMGYYNYRVTGRVLQLPYLEHEKQYVVFSPLLWETRPTAAPNYTSSSLRDFWLIGDRGDKQSARDHLLKAHVSDLLQLMGFYLGWPLVICAFGFARPLWRDRATRHALLLAVAFYAGVALDARLFPHYAAPSTALAYVVAASVLRTARKAWPGRPAERMYITWGMAGVFVLTTALGMPGPQNRFLFGDVDYHVQAKQATVAGRLEKVPGEHLVLVHYGPHHDLYQELVYNRADIERSRIVWARSLSPEKDAALVQHYQGRKMWLLEEDGEVKLTPYSNPDTTYYDPPRERAFP